MIEVESGCRTTLISALVPAGKVEDFATFLIGLS
jgi:hypothetical protein